MDGDGCHAMAGLSVLQILESVSPDGLHPNSMGMGRLAQCISPLVYQFAGLPATVYATAKSRLTAGRH